MKNTKLSRIALLLCFLGMTLLAKAEPDPNYHIYICWGQSNMEGQGNIEQQDKSVDKRFQMMATVDNCSGRKLGTWNDAVPPLASCDGKLGPTDYFGRTMVEKTDEKIKVGVIVVAVAGCDIGLFSKDNYRNYTGGQSWYTNRVNAYGGNPYGRLIEMAQKAQQDGVIKGIIFHQGETNAGDGNWPSNVKKVYDNIIKDLGLGELQKEAKESSRTLKEAREVVEREVIGRALKDSNANLTLAATILGIDRKVLREVMERLGMKKEDFKN